MKLIPVTRGIFAKVDDDDFESLSKNHWWVEFNKGTRTFVAKRESRKRDQCGPGKNIYMHREIMNPPVGLLVDHINHDTLDNQKNNLRLATSTQNAQNRKGPTSRNKCGHLGVHFEKQCGKWEANIRVNGKKIRLGQSRDIETAIARRKAAVIKYFGEFAGA